jgi:chaperonin GroES
MVDNTSGVEPLDMRVLVRPDPVEERTVGGIILPDQAIEQQKYATVKGTLIATGSNAWCEAKSARGFVAPVPGARVMIAKYGGVVLKGDDGEEYRMMNDEDVVGVLKEG